MNYDAWNHELKQIFKYENRTNAGNFTLALCFSFLNKWNLKYKLQSW